MNDPVGLAVEIRIASIHLVATGHKLEVFGYGRYHLVYSADGIGSGIGYIPASGHIAQLIILVGGREGDGPGSTVVSSSLLRRHDLNSERACAGDGEVGTGQAAVCILILNIILVGRIIVEREIRTRETAACMLQTILAKSLDNQAIGYIQQFGTIVLMSSVDAVWPHVLMIATEHIGIIVGKEAHHLCGAVTQPLTCAIAIAIDARAQVMTAPFCVGPWDDAYAMKEFVQQCARALIRGIGSHAHPASIRAVGSGHARIIAHTGREPRDGS